MPELKATRTMPMGVDMVGPGLSIRMPAQHAIVSIQIERTSADADPPNVRGIHFPRNPNTTAGRDPLLWWKGPEHWLATSEGLAASDLVAEITAALEGRVCAIVDISDSMTTFQLIGNAVPALFARGTALDLDRDTFGPGRCARTRLANIAVLLRPLEENGYELLVDRSEAQFLLEWLRDASTGLDLRRPGVQETDTVSAGVAVNAAGASPPLTIP
jgi:sarcosine oxidase subunit gamma